MAASTVASLVNNLETSSDKRSSLEDLKLVLSSVSPHELKNVVPDVSIVPVFECLNTDDEAQQEVCCSVLDRMLSALSSTLILENLQEQFVHWLKQGSEHVQSLCLSQLLRVSLDSPELLCQSVELMVGVTAQLASNSQNVACLATTVLVNTGATERGLTTLYDGPVYEKLQTVMARDDTVRYRVYQLVVELSSVSPAALEVPNHSGLLIKLVNEMQKDDVLLQLNCLELLSDLALAPHGLAFLDQQGVVTRLEDAMATARTSPYSAFLLPGLMKFFGGLARFHPKEILNNSCTFTTMVFEAVGEQGDPNVKGLAVDTIGYIGSTPEGKNALEKQGNIMTDCLGNLGRIINNSPSDLKAKALSCVANLLTLQVADQTEDLLRIIETWFSRLCSNPFDVVWSIAKQPFCDLSVPAAQVLQSLALSPWGQQLMNNAAGFKEYLLDRSVDSTKEAKDAKFQVVRVLSESPTTASIFGQPYYVQLSAFYQQGPFYVQAQSEVAYEET